MAMEIVLFGDDFPTYKPPFVVGVPLLCLIIEGPKGISHRICAGKTGHCSVANWDKCPRASMVLFT
jgi:hypothetical protein